MRLYVGNLNYQTGQDTLRGLFQEYGEVVYTKIISDRESGQSRGFGFVEMQNKNEAIEAISQLNGHELEGRSLKVNEAHEKSNSAGRRPERW